MKIGIIGGPTLYPVKCCDKKVRFSEYFANEGYCNEHMHELVKDSKCQEAEME